MKVKLTLILSVFFIIVGALQAQTEKPFRFGVIGGMNLSNIKARQDNRLSYHIGIKAEYTLPLNLYIESGLMYTKKGYEYDWKDTKTDIFQPENDKPQNVIMTHIRNGFSKKDLLELPIHLGYKFKVSSNMKIIGSVGGYLAYGLSGNENATHFFLCEYPENESISIPSNFPTTKFVFYNNKTYNIEKRFDWGLGLKAGVELFNRLQISASYDWGMNKLYKGISEGNNRNFMVSFAFLIL